MTAPPPADDTLPHSAERGAALPEFFRARRLIAPAAILLLLLLATFLPPYLNVSRFQLRIAANLSDALGRPVHLDSVTLSLFPLPGFTLNNFVVDEDPAFGAEPVLRADQVHATVRIASLWSRRVEFSRIALTEPHVNLVRAPDGRWNLQSILLQASRTEAAPTTQRTAGPAPRFPYIEATGARVNLKLGETKTPWSLTEADFALWLPQPRQWRFRLEARPQRTDTAPADSGIVKLEATLGGALAHAPGDIPIDLHGNLQDARLGGLSRLLLGRDAGVRGDLNVDLRILGTVGHASVASTVTLAHGRRAEFVPPHLVSLQAACQATAADTFHAFTQIECHWPPPGSAGDSLAVLSANVPDTRHLELSSATLTLPALPTSTLLDWLRAATPNPPAGLAGTGILSGSVSWNPRSSPSLAIPRPRSASRKDPLMSSLAEPWSGELELINETLQLPNLEPIPLGALLLRIHSGPSTTLELRPVSLPLGGRQPVLLEARAERSGYTLHLSGSATRVRLLGLAEAFPQFGDGLRTLLVPESARQTSESESDAAPDQWDLTATRAWAGSQTWTQLPKGPPAAGHRRRR